MAITNSDVANALQALRTAINALSDAIAAQSKQVNDLAEENQRLHDTVKNRDETIAWMRDKAEEGKRTNNDLATKLSQLELDISRLRSELHKANRDSDELLRANLEASDEIRGLRQAILDIAVTTAKANDLIPKNPPPASVPVPAQTPHSLDPASTFGG